MLRTHLQRVGDELDRDPADWSKLKAALADLLVFLTSPVGRTHANCDATDRVFMFQLSEHPAAVGLPNDLAEIFFDMGGALHDTVRAPEIATNFQSTPEQLLARVAALPY